MRLDQWQTVVRCVRGERRGAPPVALIVDSPWIPGYAGISTLDYLTVPESWVAANLKVERDFPEVIFLPGFWMETGMCAEPSAFGCKLSFYADKTPSAHPFLADIEDLAQLELPNVLSDGLMPILLHGYRRMEPRINEAGQVIKVVAARGPLTVASHLLGVSNFLLGLKLNPAATHRGLRLTTTLVRQWLQAQAEALREVEGILVLDDLVGFLSPKDYLEFAHPYLKEIFEAFPRVIKIFHNDTDNPVSYGHLRALGIDIFNFTHRQSIARVRALVGPEVCLMGNVAPLEALVRSTPGQVLQAALECLKSHGSSDRLLLSAGGGTSPGTPGDNIRALIQATTTDLNS